MARWPLVVSLALCWLRSADIAAAAASGRAEWDFTVQLDGKPIGSHRFTRDADVDSGTRTLTSVADFSVRFLGITAYRYRHRAVERWRGDCLQSLDADTDDDGRRTEVRAEQVGEQLQVHATRPAEGGAASAVDTSATGCVMSFAYWNPALRAQTRLLDPQTGRIEAVAFTPLASAAIEVHDRPVPATGWRIGGLAQPIDLWYAAGGAWIGLDTIVGGGRRLSYRID